MNRISKLAVLLCVLFVAFAPVMVFAADGDPAAADTAVASGKATYGVAAAAIGAGLVIIGGAMGIGKIGANTVDSMARQPEIAGAIQTAMIISAALIEGVTFFALIICLLCVF